MDTFEQDGRASAVPGERPVAEQGTCLQSGGDSGAAAARLRRTARARAIYS